ncbi:MAG: site-2 protease family protein, partial [Planctomycetota bacterium]
MDPASISPSLAIFLIAFGFGFIIFVHEMGHFLVAKAVGIHCTQFAIGFGQSLLTWRRGIGFRVGSTEREYYTRIAKHLEMELGPNGEPPESIPTEKLSKAAAELGLGETEYRFNWMPLGGYVKMVGQEDMDPTALSSDPRAFNNAPIWARMCVISAGVIMNAIFAIFFFVGAFLYGVAFPPAQVGAVTPGSPAAIAVAQNDPNAIGLKMGDRVVLLNGEKPSDFMDLSIASALSAEGEKVTLTVERPLEDNARYEFVLEPKVDPISELRSIGIAPPFGLRLNSKAVNIPDNLKEMGLQPGMTLKKVNGQPV